MVKENEADGLVSGAIHSTADTLRPALQILKTAPDTKLVSAFFLMLVPNASMGKMELLYFPIVVKCKSKFRGISRNCSFFKQKL